eukprot:TRINITY_DN118_c0_g1_i1.p1 TRINITY_DN118_c0_g1~~TRINITY_DN118_c0_g1_i1.p1  ORF type:complete len:702 (+),score=256.12 TRINITY_DN118_c0_g1_i1:37-2106(+)
MLPTNTKNIRRVKKSVNTMYLDWKRWLPFNSACGLITFTVIISISFILGFSLLRVKSQFEIETYLLKNERNELRSLLRKHNLERQQIEQVLVDSQMILAQRESTIVDLRDTISGKDNLINKLYDQTLTNNLVNQNNVPQNNNNIPNSFQNFNSDKNDDIKSIIEKELEEQRKRDEKIKLEQEAFDKAMEAKRIEDAKKLSNQRQFKWQEDFPEGTVLPTYDDPSVADKRDAVKEAFLHAWNSYKIHAWGKDELKPISKSYSNWLDLGLTIVDSLDTLWIMDLKEDFKEARDWIAESLTFNKNREISLFETVIRELGGLLSAYEFSKDKVFLTQAEDLGKRLLKGFESETGLPYASIHLTSGKGKSPSWTGGASILSEMGTVQLEFLYLAYHMNKPEYAIKPLDVFKHLDSLDTPNGLYPLYVHPRTGNFQGKEISIGALGDSFYEYELKLWLFTNKQVDGYRRMYEESAEGIINVMIHESDDRHLQYVDQINRGGRFDNRMEHLTCFAGGMFALGGWHNIVPSEASKHISIGGNVTETCHESYAATATGIGPEYFEFKNGGSVQVPSRGRHYLLRPETVESFFILWRTTHDPKYRDWAWQAFQAINEHCRTPNGFSGINDVDAVPTTFDDTQQSFFLAETLKYLYLIFSPDELIPLDKYVFNTEAHPLGIIEEPLESYPQELQFHFVLT